MKLRIQYVNKKIKPGNYIGMNYEAAKQLKIPFKHKSKKHTIVIYKKVKKKTRLNTIHHECAEKYAVKNLNMNRKDSHNFALKFEKKNKPFPTANIKQKLKKMEMIK